MCRAFLTFISIDAVNVSSTKTNNCYTTVLGVKLLKKFIWANKQNFAHSSAISSSSFDWTSLALNRKILNNINEVNKKTHHAHFQKLTDMFAFP